MSSQKSYSCGICNTTPCQISHHKSHLETQKHKDKCELFEIKLSKLSNTDIMTKYKTTVIADIVTETETIMHPVKKMNQCFTNVETEQNTDILNKMMTEQSNISNKEALKDKIHEIHNFLRNSGIGYGMNALKVFNVLYGLKKIEESDLLDKVNLKRPECEFSYLLSLAKQEKDEELVSLLFGPVLQSIHGSELRDFLFYEIPKNIKGSVFTHLIKEIDKITGIEKTCNVLLSGKIYEYFIGRDETAISEMGAYFTDRHITEYIINKVQPKLNNNGTVRSMIDMFGGSGGFTTEYINYLKKNYDTINWDEEMKNIQHYDMNPDVVKSAGLELFCLTGVIPNRYNLGICNSFYDEFCDEKFDYVITNPPYGGDKIKKTDSQIKQSKIKTFIKNELSTITDEGVRINRQKQLKLIETEEKDRKQEFEKLKVTLSVCSTRINRFAIQYKLKGGDKESCSLILIMDMLNVGGTAVGVLKEGVFFDKAYQDLRKCLIENFNVKEVISIPSDQFENTTTKTSIIIFENTAEKTTEVKFSELIVEKNSDDKFCEINGIVYINENKGDIYHVYDKLISTATSAEILKNSKFSLNGNEYNKKELAISNDYELTRLGNICECLAKSKRAASFGNTTGQYNFYTSSVKVQKCDVADYNYPNKCLIIGTGGVANIKMDNVFSCSSDNIVLNSKHNLYIYSMIKANINLLENGFHGTTINHLGKEYLLNIEIPFPKSQDKMSEWMSKITPPYDEAILKKTNANLLEKNIMNKIKHITDHEECENKKISDYLTFVNSKNKLQASDGCITGKYKFHISSQDKILYRDTYEFENIHLLIGGGGNPSLHIASHFSASGDVHILNHNMQEYMIYYIYYYLKNNIDLIGKKYIGSVIRHISKPSIRDINLKIPKNKQLIEELEESFLQLKIIQEEIKTAEELYLQYSKELSTEAIV